MAKPKPEPFRFNSMTKAELIKTVKALDKRQTKLLNTLAQTIHQRDALQLANDSFLRAAKDPDKSYIVVDGNGDVVARNALPTVDFAKPDHVTPPPKMPWEQDT